MSEWKTYHMGHSVDGPLMNWKPRDWKKATRYIMRDDKTRFTADELKLEFIKMLSKGIKTFPINGQCDNWDNETGCKGHPCDPPKEVAR